MNQYTLGLSDEEEHRRTRLRESCDWAWQYAEAQKPQEKEHEMKISDAFPSKYLKADDLRGKTIKLTIVNVLEEKIGTDERLVLYFKGKDKGLVTNKTNAMAIAAKYGDETNAWNGAEIELYSTLVSFQGQMVDAIRVRMAVPDATADEVPF